MALDGSGSHQLTGVVLEDVTPQGTLNLLDWEWGEGPKS